MPHCQREIEREANQPQRHDRLQNTIVQTLQIATQFDDVINPYLKDKNNNADGSDVNDATYGSDGGNENDDDDDNDNVDNNNDDNNDDHDNNRIAPMMMKMIISMIMVMRMMIIIMIILKLKTITMVKLIEKKKET